MGNSRTRQYVGWGLVLMAVCLGGLGLVLWGFADMFGDSSNRGPSFAAWGVGSLLFLSGVIVLATTPQDPR